MKTIPIVALIAVAIVLTSVPAKGQSPKTITNSIGLKMTRIAAGEFVMGSPRSEAERDDKEERHEVEITKPFYMGTYEVTQAQYAAVMRENRSTFKDSDNNPAENVEWTKAKEFCRILSARPQERSAGRKYRLPTEETGRAS